MSETKKVLWLSNAPYTPTGYGNQTQLFMATLPSYGHEVAIVCNYGLQGKKMDAPGVVLYPSEGKSIAMDGGMKWAVREFEPDVIITLYDPWAMKWMEDIETDKIDIPWVAWTPIDTLPAPKTTIENLEKAAAVVAYSRFGQRVLRDFHGINAEFIPHGILTNVFTPGGRAEARAFLGMPEQPFIVSIVGNNQGMPNRKAMYESMVAFRDFNQRHPDTIIYLHTTLGRLRGGLDLPTIAEDHLQLKEESVRYVNQQDYALGNLTMEYMAKVYQATDVLLNPSLGEGFGLPILEAESCATPVIANDCTSMTELVEQAGGWLVQNQPFRHPDEADQAMPLISSIIQALESAYKSWETGNQWAQRRQSARAYAMTFDFLNVIAPMWHQYLIQEKWNDGK